MEKGQLVIFIAKYDKIFSIIQKIYSDLKIKRNHLAQEPINMESVESTGYWLHNLYCAYEDLFKLVAQYFENNISVDGAFHKNLLQTMSLQINGIRPALIGDNSVKYLDELRGFRHVFRHAYLYGLDDARVIFLIHRVLNHQEHLMNDLNVFKQKLEDSHQASELSPDQTQ